MMQAYSPAAPASFTRNHTPLYASVTAAIMLVIAVAVGAALHLRHLAEERTALATQSLTRSIEQTVEGMIGAIDIALLAAADEISRQHATGKVDAPAITRLLMRQQQRLPPVAYLRATDAQGNIIFGPGLPSPPANLADRDYFIALRDNPAAGLFVAKPLVGRVVKRWVWPFIRRINKADGTFGGVVFAVIPIDDVGAMLTTLAIEPGRSIALRDGDLGLIYRNPGAALAIGGKKLSTPFIEALKANPNEGRYSSGATSIDGINREHVYRRSARYGFVVNVGLTAEAALAEWRRQVWVILALVAAFTVASLTFLHLIGRAWTRQDEDMAALATSREALQAAQKIANIGHYVFDIQEDRWTSSDTLDGIFGIGSDYPRDVEHWLALVAPESRQEMQDYLAAITARHQIFDREYRIVRPTDKQVRWVHGKGRLDFDAQGEPLRLIGTIQDITERKQIEIERTHLQGQVQQSQKMQAIGQLTGGIAHEFNNLLGVILGYTSLAIERYSGELTPKGVDYLTQVRIAAERARDLIASMLAFARGGHNGEDTAISPAPLIKEVARLLASTVPSSIKFTTRIDGNVPKIRIAPVDLQQVLTHLCLNARDAVAGAGHINVCVSLASNISGVCSACHEAFNGDFVELSVSDDGDGIAPEVQPHIFEPFFTTKDAGQGSGMGLAVVTGIVRKTGGAILVDSRPDEGSCFRVLFPVAAGNNHGVAVPPAPTFTASSPAPARSLPSVLIVDDETSLGRFLAEVLDSHGYKASVFSDSRAALRAFRAEPDAFSVVLTDQTMPGMTGITLIRELRAIRPQLPAILMTGYSELVDAQSAATLGIQHFFSKPVAIDDLLAALRQIVGQSTDAA